jgi:hypothetical protein
MQSDLDLASVNDPLTPAGSYEPETPSPSVSGKSTGSAGGLHPYAAPFVPQQPLPSAQGRMPPPSAPAPHMRKAAVPPAYPQQHAGPSSSLRVPSPSPLSVTSAPPTPLYQQDLTHMSNSVLSSGISLSLAGSGAGNANNSLAGVNSSNTSIGGSASGMLFQGSDNLDSFLGDVSTDYFGDSLNILSGNTAGTPGNASATASLPGDLNRGLGSGASSGSNSLDLLLGLRENPKDFPLEASSMSLGGSDDYSKELNLSVHSASGGGGNYGPRGPAGGAPSAGTPGSMHGMGYPGPGSRGRYPQQQHQPSSELYAEFDGNSPGMDGYFSNNSSNKSRGPTYPSAQGQANQDLYQRAPNSGGSGGDEYGEYGGAEGYGGGYGNQQGYGGGDSQQGYHYGGQGAGPYGGGMSAGAGPRGPLARTNSRPLMMGGPNQGPMQGNMQGNMQGGMQGGMMSAQQQQPKFQHKRYDVSQQPGKR